MERQEVKTFFDTLRQSLETNTFIKMTLSKYCGQEADLKNIYIRKVQVKKQDMLSFVYRYARRDITKNYPFEESFQLLTTIAGKEFCNIHLFTTDSDVQLEFSEGQVIIRTLKPSLQPKATEHNKEKQYLIDSSLLFLKELGVTDNKGKVKADMYDKYKQINKFIEVIDSLFQHADVFKKDHITIVDFGSGKSYLTFAVYHYFKELKGKSVEVIGVEQREDMINKSNEAAEKVGYARLCFVQSSIEDYQLKKTDMVIALHACDTATDDTIIKGLQAKADVIILSPCCHKFVRKHMKSPEVLHPVLKHGILEQRQSEILTDGLRAMTLEYFGYKTQVFEFISQEYTSKNLLLTAVKTNQTQQPQILEKIKKLKELFQMDTYYLDTLFSSTADTSKESSSLSSQGSIFTSGK